MSESAAQADPTQDAVEHASDSTSFDVLFTHFHPRLVRFLSKRLEGTSVDAEDVAQEAMIKAWRKREQYNPKYQFSTWVYTIAQRTASDHLRKSRPVSSLAALEQLEQTAANVKRDTQQHTDEIWSTAANLLPENQYEALWLRYGEEMTIKEVSKSLSKSTVATRVLLHRARTSLQRHLSTGDFPTGGLSS
ncbi:MAG: sigma-70 family RNA polymerase sigma factor [Planctomycetota bacterium]